MHIGVESDLRGYGDKSQIWRSFDAVGGKIEKSSGDAHKMFD